MMTCANNGVARRYFTLFIWNQENGAWEDEFGDYDRKVVRQELMDHSAKKKHKRIVEHDDSSVAMFAARDSLEAPKGSKKVYFDIETFDNLWVSSFGGN